MAILRKNSSRKTFIFDLKRFDFLGFVLYLDVETIIEQETVLWIFVSLNDIFRDRDRDRD